jgi:hypothetical protein
VVRQYDLKSRGSLGEDGRCQFKREATKIDDRDSEVGGSNDTGLTGGALSVQS